ncbi:CobW family GTP-binding protein [Rubrimonas cliftonensis]|uniref:GTPase, G3E family n=1 Tax=Rubrimonas cliftonensis TaxID=89524 RepID=A0A1H4FCT5_9RHOB|nr:GTP-binding protein [Rubrimonas cliftonensis]SEA94548.1 GTPase, G3E family [Rubrimonas cliftonensis]
MTNFIAERIPISVLTGFLGSGKTTLLSRLLRHPAMSRTAVVINELGEVGLDGALVEAVDEEMVVLDSGCICCTVRGDLVETLGRLREARENGRGPAFERVLVETTGLADPTPILHTLMTDPALAAGYRMDGVITTIDAVLGADQLDRHTQSVKQAALADRLVLTKSDLADPETVQALTARLRSINPAVVPIRVVRGAVDPDALLGAGHPDLASRTADVRAWLNEEAAAQDGHGGHGHDCASGCDHHGPHHGAFRHDDRIASFCLSGDAPMDWADVDEAFGLLLQLHGEQVLRVKGLLDVRGSDRPIVIHGVQHLFSEPAMLAAWPDGMNGTRIVFITHDLPEARVRQVLEPFLPIARGAEPGRRDHGGHPPPPVTTTHPHGEP